MVQARYGLQFHWTSHSQPRRGPRKPYAQAVRDFDVKAFADTVSETGAGYVTVTTSHAEYYFPAPIRAIDGVLPGRTTERDLPADLADALGRKGIRLMLYFHVGHDHWQERDGWWKRFGFDPADPGRFLDNWCRIQEEIGARYGAKLAGGNGIFTGGPQKGLQAHANFVLEKDWCHWQPETPIPPPGVDKDTFVRDMESAIRRGIVPSVNLEIYQDGTMSPQSLEWMRAVRAAVKGK
jgi:hypothetical protein